MFANRPMKRKIIVRISDTDRIRVKRVSLLNKAQADAFLPDSNSVVTVKKSFTFSKTPLRSEAFKFRAENLQAYQATFENGKIVLPEKGVYIPKKHFSKQQYKKAMEHAVKTISLKNV